MPDFCNAFIGPVKVYLTYESYQHCGSFAEWLGGNIHLYRPHSLLEVKSKSQQMVTAGWNSGFEISAFSS